MDHVTLCMLGLLAVVEASGGDITITRHYQGDLFGATELNCTEEDCAIGGRGASRLPWMPCLCQCLPSTPVFRQDRGDCVNRIEECMQAVFVGPVTLERIPIVFPPMIKGQSIHISTEIALSGEDFPPSSSKPNCGILGVNVLTSSGWQEYSREDAVFYLDSQDGQWFVKFSGDVDIGSTLDGQLVLLNVTCGELDSPGLQQGALAPCIVFRMAGTTGPGSITLAAPPTSRGTDYAVMGLCVGLLGLTYVLGVLVYLIVRRHRIKKQKQLEDDASESGESVLREGTQDLSHNQRRDEKHTWKETRARNPFSYRRDHALTITDETPSPPSSDNRGIDNPNFTDDPLTGGNNTSSQGNNPTNENNPRRNDEPTPLARIPEEDELRDQNEGKYHFVSFREAMQQRRVPLNKQRITSEEVVDVEPDEESSIPSQNTSNNVPIYGRRYLNRIRESEDGFESDSLERQSRERSGQFSSDSERNVYNRSEQNIRIFKVNRNGGAPSRKVDRSESVYRKSGATSGHRMRYRSHRKLRSRRSVYRPWWLRAVRVSVNRVYQYLRGGEEGAGNKAPVSSSRSPHPFRAAFVKKSHRRRRLDSQHNAFCDPPEEIVNYVTVGWKKKRTPPDGSCAVRDIDAHNNGLRRKNDHGNIIVHDHNRPNGKRIVEMDQHVEVIEDVSNTSIKSSLRHTLALIRTNVDSHHVSQPAGYTELIHTASLDETYCDSLESSPVLDRKIEAQNL